MPSQISRTQSTYEYGKCSSTSNYSDSSSSSLSTISTLDSGELPLYTIIGNPHDHASWDKAQESRISTETYASTSSSVGGPADKLSPCEVSEVSDYPKPLTSSPEEFAEYFPSMQTFSIRHDPTTNDGNMNLRIDTEAQKLDGGKIDLQLFHLRMYDLKRREFSLRRYSRDSGREVCRSSRKYTKPSVILRPGLPRSMSNAFSSLLSKSESKTSTMTSLVRHDSGYDSFHEDDIVEDIACQPPRPSSSTPIPTNTVQLGFSNYAHLEVKARGPKTCKRYEIEYWGTKYAWKRNVVRKGDFEEVSHHLINTKTSAPLAYIVQLPLSESERLEEAAKGGWVPPCTMFFEDAVLDGSTDLAE